MTLKQKLYTIWVFFIVNIKRLFRDKTALFFTFLFPLIFLFVFGALSRSESVSFNVAIINKSKAPFAQEFTKTLGKDKVFKINTDTTSLEKASEKMSRGELDAAIELPAGFGEAINGHMYPSGKAIVHYTQNNDQAARTLSSVLQTVFQDLNSKFIPTETPLSVETKRINQRSLSTFDYTFTGLLGFAVLGSGIFGPINVFPELKKMGILRRLHTTPLRVWQYFLSVMVSNAVVGLLSVLVMCLVAIAVFDLKTVGDPLQLGIFLTLGIVTLLGIGLAIGGWAKNERQAAPLANIVVFPMMFLSGTFFPRFLMPEWVQHISSFMPLTPVIDGARLIATEGKGLLDLGPQLGVLGVWLVVVYLIAFRVFRWE